ncbi:hypothetical protein Tco_0215164 [Tanacetum coccineum]
MDTVHHVIQAAKEYAENFPSEVFGAYTEGEAVSVVLLVVHWYYVPNASVQSATKRATPKKPTTTTPVKQSKPAPPPTKKPSKRKLPQKVRKGKPSFQLFDEDGKLNQDSIPHE